MLFINIRASCKQLEMDHLETMIYDGGNPEIKFEGKDGARQKQWLLLSQQKQVKRRDRDIIVRKMRNNEKLTKKEDEMLNSEIDNHM